MDDRDPEEYERQALEKLTAGQRVNYAMFAAYVEARIEAMLGRRCEHGIRVPGCLRCEVIKAEVREAGRASGARPSGREGGR